MRPPSTGSRPASIRRVVDLPQPEGPTSTRNSPSAMSSVMPSTAGASSLENRRVASSKYTVAMDALCCRAVRDGFDPRPYAVRARQREGADGIRQGWCGDASGAELALDLRVEDLLALGVQSLEDGRDVLALDDLVEALADAGATTGQQHADVVLGPRLGQLLDGRLGVGVLLEIGLLRREVDGGLAHG